MHKNSSLLTLLCILSMMLLLALQGYWLNKYYLLIKKTFEKEVNMAFEDAIKKEFSNRADTIQGLLKERLLDSNLYTLSGKFDKKESRVIYTVSPNAMPADQYSNSISFKDFNVLPTAENREEVVQAIADRFSKALRNEDLDNHMVYYRIQDLGKYMLDLTQKIEFDTVNLRPVLTKYLADRDIFVDYNFYTREQDSTTNSSSFDPSLLEKYPVITRSLPTYRSTPGQNYVRVLFTDPLPYIIANMWLILASSVVLVVLIALCMNFLLKSLSMEKKLSLIKNDFISNITHEFKTPIATAMVAVEALGEKEVQRNEEKYTRYLSHARNELKRISGLTDKILKLSLYDAGNYNAKKESIKVDDVIRELIDIHLLSEKTTDIVFTDTSGLEEIMADRVQFQHAISNIIENAIKYGLAPIHIHISCYLQDGYFVTSVKDNGPGIAPADLPFVFEKFYRVKQDSFKTVKGYGLGLNYVKQIMEHHDGYHQLKSDKNGTELILGWPL